MEADWGLMGWWGWNCKDSWVAAVSYYDDWRQKINLFGCTFCTNAMFASEVKQCWARLVLGWVTA